ncbi:4489_t:CDS:2, partial [Cetraspora pellucida]
KELVEERWQKEEKVERNVKENVWMNVKEDVKVNIKGDVEVNVKKDVEANVETNVEENAEMNVEVNVVINAEKNVEVNVVINVEQDVEVNVEKKAEEEIAQDLEKDSELDIKEDNENRNNEDEKTYKHLFTFGAFSILTNAAKETHKITSFFKATNTSLTNEVSSIMAYEGINQLYEYLVKNGHLITASEYNKHQAVYEYLVLLKSSSFLLSQHGKYLKHMRLVDDENIAMQFNNLLEQIRDKVIPIFKANFSNAIAIFAFDNSTNHGAYAEDAFIAARMNLKPGENQSKMQLTTFVDADG